MIHSHRAGDYGASMDPNAEKGLKNIDPKMIELITNEV